MFHIGIIGCGKIAQVRHIPEYADNPDTQLTAFYDLNAARAQELAERYGAKAYDSVEALLADPNVDAVSICSANTSHAQIAVAALEAGKHVLCEKPMATTLADILRSRGSVAAEEYREDGVFYRATVKIDDLHRFEPFLV